MMALPKLDSSINRLPKFPTDERYLTHNRAVLAMLLRGDHCDQFSYHTKTRLPLVDFRTRVSNLTLDGWPIDREFHATRDTNGEPRRCKHYWLNIEDMAAMFAANPDFKARCESFIRVYGGVQ